MSTQDEEELHEAPTHGLHEAPTTQDESVYTLREEEEEEEEEAKKGEAESPAPGRYCAECKKHFSRPSSLTRHLQSKHGATKGFPCLDCGKKFALDYVLQTHIRTQHKNKYRFKCPVCAKGYESQRALDKHHRSHDVESVGPNIAMSFLAEETERLHATLVSARKAQRYGCKKTKKGSCQIATSDRTNPQVVFACAGGCERVLHWECVGYDSELSALPAVVCPFCLEASGRSVGAAGVALSSRRLIEEYAEQMHYTIENVPLDGACLLRCVALVVKDMTQAELLQQALNVIPTMEEIPEEDRELVAAQCKELAGKRTRGLGDKWDSLLFDYLPQALAVVTGRPLHILEVIGGSIKMHVRSRAKEQGDDGAAGGAEPIMLMRSYSEIGVAHYDLLRSGGTV